MLLLFSFWPFFSSSLIHPLHKKSGCAEYACTFVILLNFAERHSQLGVGQYHHIPLPLATEATSPEQFEVILKQSPHNWLHFKMLNVARRIRQSYTSKTSFTVYLFLAY